MLRYRHDRHGPGCDSFDLEGVATSRRGREGPAGGVMDILGISAFYHDSAACLVRDGAIVAAAQEERFTRKKHDPRFPKEAVQYCLREGGIALTDLRYIAFYDKPLVKFERLLETYLAFAPRGIRSFVTAMPVWLKEKLFLKSLLQKQLRAISGGKKADLPPVLFGEHHESHAASALRRAFDPNATTYRVPQTPRPGAHMLRQF